MHSRFRPSPAMLVALIALFVSLGGTAAALSGSNTVFSDDIANDTFNSPTEGQGGLVAADLRPNSVGTSEVALNSLGAGDLAPGSVGTSEVANSSLTGSDIQTDSLTGSQVNENTLGEVPSAQIGGFGRHAQGGSCNPTSDFYLDCRITTINLPRAAKVLLIGHFTAWAPFSSSGGRGQCKLVTNTGDLPSTYGNIYVPPGPDGTTYEQGALAGITGVLGAGSHDFAVDCNQVAGDIRYIGVGITAVAISPD